MPSTLLPRRAGQVPPDLADEVADVVKRLGDDVIKASRLCFLLTLSSEDQRDNGDGLGRRIALKAFGQPQAGRLGWTDLGQHKVGPKLTGKLDSLSIVGGQSYLRPELYLDEGLEQVAELWVG